MSPPLQPPLIPQRSQILLMQMITLHPEQHIRHRNQRQCHKQVNPTPSHKRKPTIHKILINANADRPPPRYLSMKTCINVQQKNSPESCIIPQITPKFERLIHPSPTVHAAHFVLECSQPRRHVRNLGHYLIASLMHSTIYLTSSSVT